MPSASKKWLPLRGPAAKGGWGVPSSHQPNVPHTHALRRGRCPHRPTSFHHRPSFVPVILSVLQSAANLLIPACRGQAHNHLCAASGRIRPPPPFHHRPSLVLVILSERSESKDPFSCGAFQGMRILRLHSASLHSAQDDSIKVRGAGGGGRGGHRPLQGAERSPPSPLEQCRGLKNTSDVLASL